MQVNVGGFLAKHPTYKEADPARYSKIGLRDRLKDKLMDKLLDKLPSLFSG